MQDNQIAGTPLELSIPNYHSNIDNGRANSPGYGKNLKDWVIRSQVPFLKMECSSSTKWLSVIYRSLLHLTLYGLRYSQTLYENMRNSMLDAIQNAAVKIILLRLTGNCFSSWIYNLEKINSANKSVSNETYNYLVFF